MVKLKKFLPVRWLLILMIFSILSICPVCAEELKTEIISDFEVFDADIRDVFRTLAELGGINILMDPQVKGDVSIKLKYGLAIKEAIELLSQTYGYSYRWINQTRTVIIGNEKTFSNFESRETKIYHLSYASPEQVKNALKIIIPEDKIGVDPRTNQLTIKASILEHQNIEEIIARLDREMPQLNIEARMEELSRSATKKLGLTWDFGQLKSSQNFKLETWATISALEESNEARLLANPNISITDSQEGKILIGDKFPIITTNRSSTGIEYIITYLEIGTKLYVTPRINEENIVTIAIKAEVSTVKEWRKTGEGDDIPVITTREASSVVRLREGETFVLSGLHKETSTVSASGLPGISKVPLIGRLFGTKKTDPNEQTEVVIFVTPKIIRLKNEEIDTSKNVHTIGKQPQPAPETPAPKTTAAQAAPVPVIATPAVKEETIANGTTGGKETVKNIPKESPAAGPQNVKPAVKTAPLRSEIVEKEVPVEEKELPDLSRLPRVDDNTPAIGSVQPGPNSAPAIAAGFEKIKVKIKQGETIASLAQKYGITKESIVTANNWKPERGNPAAGTELILPIPKSHFYEVKPNETLWRIAKRYGTTVELLMEINNITDHTKVGKGQKIILPVAVDKVMNSKF